MPHSSRATGVALLILALTAAPTPRLSYASIQQTDGPTSGTVNQQLAIDASRFRPFEIEYEEVADDGRQMVTTVSYAIDATSGPEPLVTRRFTQEYTDWSGGFPKKTRHYVIVSTARAADLQPVRTKVVNQYWKDPEASWVTERMTAVFTPGSVSRRLETTDDTTDIETDLPPGTLQAGLVALAIGLSAEPPRDLALTSYEWLNQTIDREVYTAVASDTITAAGHTFDAILVEGVDAESSEVVSRVFYRAEVPRFFISTAGENPITIRRVREGP